MTPTTLRIELENVDFRLPTQVTDDNSVMALKSLVLEPLLQWQPGGAVKPGLFAIWTHSKDGKIWRFTIRENALFHNGSLCTALDIVTYIEGLLNSRDYFDMPWSYSRYFKQSQITAEDDRTVCIASSEPFSDVLDILASSGQLNSRKMASQCLGQVLTRSRISSATMALAERLCSMCI